MPARRMRRIGWLSIVESFELRVESLFPSFFLTKFGNTVKNATAPKIIQLIGSMKLVGLISIKAAEAMSPITVKRIIRSVCSK